MRQDKRYKTWYRGNQSIRYADAAVEPDPMLHGTINLDRTLGSLGLFYWLVGRELYRYLLLIVV